MLSVEGLICLLAFQLKLFGFHSLEVGTNALSRLYFSNVRNMNIAGVIAFKTLRKPSGGVLESTLLNAIHVIARQYFGTLQHKTFPIYFVLSILLSSALLSLWVFNHPDVLAHITQPNVADVAQAYVLAVVLLFQGLNYFVVGPLTSKYILFFYGRNYLVMIVDGRTMFERQKLEKKEGKVYSDPGVKHFLYYIISLIFTRETLGFG